MTSELRVSEDFSAQLGHAWRGFRYDQSTLVGFDSHTRTQAGMASGPLSLMRGFGAFTLSQLGHALLGFWGFGGWGSGGEVSWNFSRPPVDLFGFRHLGLGSRVLCANP